MIPALARRRRGAVGLVDLGARRDPKLGQRFFRRGLVGRDRISAGQIFGSDRRLILGGSGQGRGQKHRDEDESQTGEADPNSLHARLITSRARERYRPAAPVKSRLVRQKLTSRLTTGNSVAKRHS